MRKPRPGRTPEARSSSERLLAVLGLFTLDDSAWTVEDAAARLRISSPTAYRYFNRLASVGLISAASRASYVLGPAIVELDRQIRLRDPLLIAGRPTMDHLIRYSEDGSTILLCRLYKDRVVCIHQVVGRGPQGPISYERGRPMPLFRGATSKIILANLPLRTRAALYRQNRTTIRAAGLGRTWEEFTGSLAQLRRRGVAVTEAEIDPSRMGIAAPILNPDGRVAGSLTFVLPRIKADRDLVERLASATIAGAHEIARALTERQGRVSRRGSR